MRCCVCKTERDRFGNRKCVGLSRWSDFTAHADHRDCCSTSCLQLNALPVATRSGSQYGHPERLQCNSSPESGMISRMKLQLYRYGCDTCSEWFTLPDICVFAYGEFLLKTNDSSEFRYLNANRDAVFSEVDHILSGADSYCSMDSFEQAKVLHAIFGVACDHSSNGERFESGALPNCKTCGGRVNKWEAVEPPTFVDIDVPEVSHSAWSTLDDSMKREIVFKALNRIKQSR